MTVIGRVKTFNMSGFKLYRLLALVPLAYMFTTRIHRVRDLLYLVASSWIPAIWILFRLSDHGWIGAVASFALGYLAFVAIYELGYLANDVWDAARSPEGRPRLRFSIGSGFIAVFVAVRVMLWLGIGYATGWLDNPIWLAGYGALAASFTLHNMLTDNGWRVASFLQLATLRFSLPILGAVAHGSIAILVLIALLYYTYLRTLSYMDSKSLLLMPGRSRPNFGFLQLAVMAPISLFLSIAVGTSLPTEIYAYFLIVHGIWWLAARPAQDRSG